MKSEYSSNQKQDYLYDLFERLSARLNKPISEMKSFYHTLKDNWYDNELALRQLTDEQYNEMKIPGRLVNAIKEELGIKMQGARNELVQQMNNTTQNKGSDKSPQKSLNEYTMIQYVNELDNKLQSRYKQDLSQVGEIFEKLYKIIHNIIQDPYEMKYRTLKKSNNMVQKIITSNAPVGNFLALFGFEQDNEKYYLHTPKTHELLFVEQVILQKAQGYKKYTFQPFLGDIKMPEKPTQEIQMMKRNEGSQMKSFEQQFSKEKLSEMRYVDALDKLLEFRHKIMSESPKDRKLRIYHKRFQTKNANQLVEVNMQEEFQKSEDKMIQGYWKQILTDNRKNSNFQSKRKTEFEFLIKQKIHKETIIKVKLPNEFIIEARFGPLEKLKDVFQLASNIIIGDMYLFQAPPPKRLDKDMQKTLSELDSVPMGSFYLGVNGDYYISNQYINIIEK